MFDELFDFFGDRDSRNERRAQDGSARKRGGIRGFFARLFGGGREGPSEYSDSAYRDSDRPSERGYDRDDERGYDRDGAPGRYSDERGRRRRENDGFDFDSD